MTLENFFTLTEMNNGLTTPSQVRELMAVMQQGSNSIVKNAAKSMRQWSAVASAIAATENKDCLDLFIQLDGLHFISKWLKDAMKFRNDKVDGLVEESITHLLRALEKLQVDYGKLLGSEIWATVQDLFVHNSLKVQDKARMLFESWKAKRGCDGSLSDIKKSKTFTDDESGKYADTQRGIKRAESSLGDDSMSRQTSAKEKIHEITRDDLVLSTDSDSVHEGQVETAHNLDQTLDLPIVERPLDHVSLRSLPESTMKPPCHSDGTAVEPCSPAVSKLDTIDTHTEFHNLESPSNKKLSPKIEISSDKLGLIEELKTSEGRHFTSSPDAVDEMKPESEVSSHKNSTAGDKSSRDECLSCVNSMTIDSDGKVAIDSDDFTCRLQNASSSEKSWGNTKDLGTLFSGIEDDGKGKALGQNLNGHNLSSNYTFGKKHMAREPDQAGKKSGVEIDYGIVDPLEVARLVAIEVEREIVDYREQSCSSSEKLPEDIRQPHSPNSVSEKQSHASEGSAKEVAEDQNLSDKSSPMQQESPTSSGNLDGEQTSGTQGIASPKVSVAAQEAANSEKGFYLFDLNQKVCPEDVDHAENQNSNPISVVSASRAAAAPGLPGASLPFEGNFHWKGSAATSAFCPASPCRVPENDMDNSTGGSSSSSKHRQGHLHIDLNIAESVVARTGDISPDKHVQVSPSLTCGEPTVETNSKKSEHVELDLNRASEDVGPPSDQQMRYFFPQRNLYSNHSHSSSSSKQPIRNIDLNLNDQPSFLNDSCDNSSLSMVSQNFNVSGGIKSTDSMISIMGTRVEVNERDLVSPPLPLPNGQTSELAFDVNLGRTGSSLGFGSLLPYAHSSAYGYNNIAPGHNMPFSSTVYGSGGPIPYMVDSRGAPVIPQIAGSASTVPGGFSQPPFVVNMNSSAASIGMRPWRSSFELNSGMLVESGSKDPAGLGPFLNSTHTRSLDEQLRSHSQSTMSSAVGGKRKEPDNGWEHYPFRPYMPPWKPS